MDQQHEPFAAQSMCRGAWVHGGNLQPKIERQWNHGSSCDEVGLPKSWHTKRRANTDLRQSWEWGSGKPLAWLAAWGTGATAYRECRSIVCHLRFQVFTVAARVCVTKEVSKGDGVWDREYIWVHPGCTWGPGSGEGETGVKSGKCGTHEDTYSALAVPRDKRSIAFKVASHSNRRMGVLPCFLLVKSSFTVVSQFTLFLSLAEHCCWVPGWAGQSVARWWGRKGTSGPRAGHHCATLAMALELEQCKGSRCQLAGDERAPGSSNLQPGLGLGRGWGSKPVPWQLRSPLLQLCKTGSPASGFSLDSFLKWKKGDLWHLDVSKCPFLNFKWLNMARNRYCQLQNTHTQST